MSEVKTDLSRSSLTTAADITDHAALGPGGDDRRPSSGACGFQPAASTVCWAGRPDVCTTTEGLLYQPDICGRHS